MVRRMRSELQATLLRSEENSFAALPLKAAAHYSAVFASASATSGVDNITQTAGNDDLSFSNTDQAQATDAFNGGLGTDTIKLFSPTVGAGLDPIIDLNALGAGALQGYEQIQFMGAAHLDLNANLFGGAGLPSNLAIIGGASSNTVISVRNASNFDASGWTFSGWTNTANETLRVFGTTGNDTIKGSVLRDSLAGGVGDDTYTVNNLLDLVVENAGEGTDTVQSAITYTLADNVENLTLTGTVLANGFGNAENNILIGNSANNILTGLAGNDTLNGGLGIDRMVGGLGDDAYYIDSVKDIVSESAGQGTDTVYVNLTPPVTPTVIVPAVRLGLNVENVVLQGTNNVNATGNVLANTMTGNAGKNKLDGGTGADAMAGGAGDDTYVVENVLDTVTENFGEGTDTVLSNKAWTLGANVENLTLSGLTAINGTGNGLSNVIIGNSGINTLTGFAGADTLDGGKGADQLIGGQDDDTYVVDNALDVVTELSGEGYDTVNAKVNYTLGANLEKLVLASVTAKNGTGNSADNMIIGNTSANILTGMDGSDTLDGGSGADQLIGGNGDDIYVVDQIGDVIVELAGAGTGVDLIKSKANTFVMSANVENMQLETGGVTGTGNALDNIITGNAAANNLNGMAGNDTLIGGAGNDTMKGGAGDDTYSVDSTLDTVVELTGEGTDTVNASATFTLGAFVDNLNLLTGAVNGTGNAENNVINGNAAANTLSGLAGNDTINGGAGVDILIGGAGADQLTGGADLDTFKYVALTDSNAGATDTITDFVAGEKIDLSAIDTNSALAGDQAFVVDTDGIYTAGEIRILGDTVYVYADGDGVADMQFTLTGYTLSGSDFVL
jgi:Ca2+-binding RTX toxin-like protein